MFILGRATVNKGPAFSITPDTILLDGNGYAKFAESSFDSVRNQDYVPPEWNPREDFSDDEVEKIYVFSLGVTIYNAADFNLPQEEVWNVACFDHDFMKILH